MNEPADKVGLSESQLARMRDTMTARGPDAAGSFVFRNIAFAHRRLAIRDPAGGAQPWLAADGQAVLVYNGEIYNDRSLRAELTELGHHFRSQCDTEVVMAAFRQWGAGCVERLRGMFALGIYDFRDDRLLLARDRFGIKPLFVGEAAGGLLFASSIAAILAHPAVGRKPNLPAISHYLTTFRRTLGRETLFDGVWQLLPGELLSWHRGRVAIRRYWEYPADEDQTLDYDQAVEQLHVTLREAVVMRLVSDVPVGMFLSGGVDSNTLACLVRGETGQPMLGTCGGGGDESSDEFEHAARCAAHAGFDYDEVRVGADDFLDGWQAMVEQTRLPLATPSDVIIYRIAASLKRAAGVALGGEGADELLCGYAVQHWSGHDFDASRRLAGRHDLAARQFRDCLRAQYGRDTFASEVEHYFALNSLIPTSAKPLLLAPWAWEAAQHDARMLDDYRRLFDELGDAPLSRKHALLLHRVNLEALLARLDGATMLASLEARVPYTDHVLVEQMFRVPQRHKIDVSDAACAARMTSAGLEAGGHLRAKRVLRSVAGRLLPPALAERKKASFPTPVAGWLAGPWCAWARQRLTSSPFAAELFQRQALADLTDHVPQAGMWLWPLLNLAMWGDHQFCGGLDSGHGGDIAARPATAAPSHVFLPSAIHLTPSPTGSGPG